MNTFRTVVLILASISFVIVIGGATYEHLGIVPVWASAAPASLAMFQGEYPITPFKFWIPVHPVTFVLLLLSLAFNWTTARRNYIITVIVGYAFILLATFFWFVPQLMTMTQTAFNTGIDAELTKQAQTWEFWSQIRLASMFVLAFILLFGLSKSAEPLRRRY